ncbi:hypothetical protein SAMN05421863_106118 [Nitrosomonas communis]|uniref:Uncharacterized protein n=2 Tax=Nitrosomonas communis TaxID=44574 RepID=A0A1I4U8X2_9PROT|nr:hypothetical protein SAMN05421863_106118 [Nitrosomonas communis]
MRTKSFLNATLVFLLIVWAGSLYAQEHSTHTGKILETTSGSPSIYVEPYGVPLSPGIYLTNFILLYVSNPEIAANMPAYSAALPQKVYQCLVENPEGCPYSDMAKYFSEQALEVRDSQNQNIFWPLACQTDPRWQILAPPKYRQPDQINQPLGRKKADQLARLLGINEDMVLTEEQYQCQIGTPPRDLAREIIFLCTSDLTNSKGNALVPLSSYGLSLSAQGDVRSNCAPQAPCLEFNKLILGPLEKIAIECGFWDKFVRWNDPAQTPLVELAKDGVQCQDDWKPSCIVEAACPGNVAQSNNNCAASRGLSGDCSEIKQ